MAAKRYTVDVNGTKETIQTYSAQAGGGAKGEVLRFRLPRGAKVELGDEGSNQAPQGIKVRRIGDDLHIALPGSDVAKPDIIVQEFYKTDGAKGSEPAQLIGRGADGEYHAYNVGQINNNLPASPTLSTAAVSPWGKVTEAVAPVIATDTVPTAAPVAAAAAPGGVQMSTTAWVLTGVGGVAVVGALAAGGGGGGGSDSGDKPIQSVTAASSSGSVTEGENAVFTVTLRNAGNTPTTWSLSLGGDSASSADFDASKLSFSSGVTYNAVAGTVTVPAGVTSFTVTVPTVNDALIEANEAIKLDVQGTSGTVTITDNDQQSVVTVVATNGTAVIEGQPLIYTVTLNAASQSAQSYALGLTGSGANTATIGTDTGALSFTNGVTYDAGTGKITVPAGVETFEVQIATASDGGKEGAENLQLTVGGINVSGTITDNDASSVTLSTAATISEGGAATYQVLLAGTSASSEVYALDVGGTLSAGRTGTLTFSNGVTYNAANSTITVPANVAAFTVTVPVAENNLHQATETLNLKVGSKTGGTVTVNDNDPAPVLTLTQTAASVAETSTSVTYTVNLSAASALDTQVRYATTPGTATAGVDFNSASGTLNIAAGDRTGTFTVTLAGDDIAAQGNRDYSVGLSAPVNATLGAPSSVTTTITDNDTFGVQSVATTSTATPVAEGGSMVFVVTLASTSPVQQTLAYTLTGDATQLGTPTASASVAISAGNLVIPANTKTFNITVPITTDATPESEPQRDVTLSVGTGAAAVSATGHIAADALPTVTLAGDATVDENALAGVATYTVTLSTLSSQAVTVAVTATGGTGTGLATLGSDFEAPPASVTIAAGQPSATFTVPILNPDATPEANETFTVSLSTPTHATLGSPVTITTTITDTDVAAPAPAPVPAPSPAPTPATPSASTGADISRALQDAFTTVHLQATASEPQVVKTFHAGPGGDLLDVSALLGKGAMVVDAASGGDSFDAYTPAVLAQGLVLAGNTSFSVEADLHGTAPTPAQVADLLAGLQLEDGSQHVLVLGDSATPGQAYVFEIVETGAGGTAGVQASEVTAVATLNFSEGTQFADLLASNIQTTHTLA